MNLRLLGAGAACLVSLCSYNATAGTITFDESKITRKQAMRDQAHNPLWVNYSDCMADDVMTFPLDVADYLSSNAIQVWVGGAGNDCSSLVARNDTTPTCWKVWAGVATMSTLTVPIRVRDIVGQHRPPAGGPGSGTELDCNSTNENPTAVILYFMFVDGIGNNVGGILWKTKFDLMGPDAPSNLAAFPGSSAVDLTWSASASSDVANYNFFCSPKPGQETGLMSDAGACTSTAFLAGSVPDGSHLCGSVTGATANAGSVGDLKNGNSYAIGVAAVDEAGNAGKLSNVVCSEPSPKVGDLLTGRATGCACAAAPTGSSKLAIAIASAALTGIIAARRRKK